MATNNTISPVHLNESVSLVALSALPTNNFYQNLLKNTFGNLKFTEPSLGIPTGADTTTAALANGIVGYWDFSGNLTNKVNGQSLIGKIDYYDFQTYNNIKSSVHFLNAKSDRYYLKIQKPVYYSPEDDLDFLNDFTLSFWIKLSANDSLPITQDLFYKGDSIKNYMPFYAYVTFDQITLKRYIQIIT